MDNSHKRVDFISKILFIISLLFISLFYLKSILTPLFFALLLALVLLPICQRLEANGIHRIVAILLVMIMLLALTFCVGLLLSSQLNNFMADLPELKDKTRQLLDQVYHGIESVFNISEQEQLSFVRKNSTELAKTGGQYVTSAVGATTSFLSFISLVPVYCFLLLYYRNKFRKAFLQLLPNNGKEKALEIFDKIKSTVQQYVQGLGLVIFIIAILNIVGLLLLGIKYAFFLGLFSALLTIIPYVGVIAGGAIPLLVALVTKDSMWYAVGVICIYWFIQIVEGNFITPRVMGSQVNLNALAIIFGLIAGGRLWGLMGMIMAVPVLAIMQVIFSHIEVLKPFATLLGNDQKEALKKKKE